jgi:ligand-binding SRPBCC domain-containing protein
VHDHWVSKVALTTELPISAETAAALARKPETMSYVLSPILRFRGLGVPEPIEVGTRGSARLWWFGLIPAWTHHLMIRELDATEIYTNEHGGPVRTWNHRLIFEPVDEHHCRYTDEIETDAGARGALTRLFIGLMFRHRHRRWQRLARTLA